MSGTEKTTKQTQLSYWWSEYQWTIIGLLALTAFTLGLLGFFQYFSAKSEVRTSQDILYLTLQLFTLDSGAVTGPVPWSLEIARLLAPALLVYTAAKALLEIFHEQVQVFRARFAKNHVIICGLGRKGYLLARSFREAGFQVVAIELDKEKVKAVQAHRNGIIVLNGNVSDKERLRRVRVDRAAYLFSVCGDDGVNAEVAVHSRKLIKDLEGKGLTCFIHIDNNGLSGLLREREISTQQPDAFRLELFNIHERGARALLSAFQPFTSGSEDEGINHSLLVIGAGYTAQALIVQVAMQWNVLRGRANQRVLLMLVGTDATSAGAVLAERYPALNEVLELKTLEIEPDSPQFYKMRFQPGMSRESRFDQVFVCLDDDEQALTCALAMRQKLLGQGVRIIAKLMHDQGLAALMRGEAGGEPEFSDIHTFGLIENTCTPDLMLGGTHEALAQSIHDSYRRKQIVKGQTRLNNPSLVPWSELPDALKDSNRRQADHIGMKLKKIRRGIKPLKDWNAKLDEFSSEDIEFLAKLEHARWVKERSAAGWRYAPGSKNLDRKTSPFLVPWEDLTEDAKDLDRETVRSLPIFLAQAGFEIFPLEEH